MMHIIQVALAGKIETPRVFHHPAEAEAAYVNQVKAFWKQSYAAYCEQSGIEPEAFASAVAFVETLGLAERSQLNYWVVSPEGEETDAAAEVQRLAQGREKVDAVIEHLERRSAVVHEGLNGLLEELGQLKDSLAELTGTTAGPPGAAEEATPSPSPARKIEDEEPVEDYTSREWKTFVTTIMNMYGGNRSACSLLPRPVWRQDVYSEATSLEYWDWVGDRFRRYRRKAEEAGCEVVEDPDSPAQYKVRTPEGKLDESSFYSEWEAWCHAGMNLLG